MGNLEERARCEEIVVTTVLRLCRDNNAKACMCTFQAIALGLQNVNGAFTEGVWFLSFWT